MAMVRFADAAGMKRRRDRSRQDGRGERAGAEDQQYGFSDQAMHCNPTCGQGYQLREMESK